MSDRENLSGFDMQEYWDYLHSMNKQFLEIFGEKNGQDGILELGESDRPEASKSDNGQAV